MAIQFPYELCMNTHEKFDHATLVEIPAKAHVNADQIASCHFNSNILVDTDDHEAKVPKLIKLHQAILIPTVQLVEMITRQNVPMLIKLHQAVLIPTFQLVEMIMR
ncbi:hypothetical protein Nepgr_024103 [Nepenthes gracilis]|uniref:Uncharacterized protein n=1 Tax=Nepenthes gracilis TaxID=150966 RepID=A0AAD3XZQ8_NEPGR|nr:hypothetical protein Nepgr_024103 [Nepenthes gracilis]